MAEEASLRLDKWLWQARFCKTRGDAARMVAKGAVRVNTVRVVKPATPVRPGDGLTFSHGTEVRVIRVRALGCRRGPAAEARMLYDDLAAPEAPPAPLEPTRGAVK